MGNSTILNIHSLGAQGDGIATYDDKKIFIAGGLVGEDIECLIEKDTSNIFRGKILNIITPSPDRVQPPCPHYHQCGGCSQQHMNLSAYQHWTIDTVKSYLEHKNITPKIWDNPIFIPRNTRRRATFSCVRRGKKLVIGYNKQKSHDVFDLDDCTILHPDIIAIKPVLVNALHPLIHDKQKGSLFVQMADNGLDVTYTGQLGTSVEPDLLTLETIASLVQSTEIIRFSWRLDHKDSPQIMIEENPPIMRFGQLNVPLAPLAFLQPSTLGQQALTQSVREYLPENLNNAADLFSGCGTLTGEILNHTQNIDAFEGDETAISMLKKSGYQRAFVRDLFRDPLTSIELAQYDTVIIDPPRAGAKFQALELANSKVQSIIAVSCNPSTFVRDAELFINGGYILNNVKIIDQFIWSPHVELAAKFIRSS